MVLGDINHYQTEEQNHAIKHCAKFLKVVIKLASMKNCEFS